MVLRGFTRVFIRLDSSECKASDMLRHISQHLTEFSIEAANGDLSILEGWLLDLKSMYLKSGLSIGLSEAQLLEAWKVLMGFKMVLKGF